MLSQNRRFLTPSPLLVVFLLSKIGNYWPPPPPLRRHSLWTAPNGLSIKLLVCADFRLHPHAHRTPARVRARAHARTLKVWSYYYRPSNGSCIWNGSIFSSIKSKYDMKLIVDSFTRSYLFTFCEPKIVLKIKTTQF